MRVLITGGAGYIGTELVCRLINNNTIEKIIVYDNLSRGNYNLFLGPHPRTQKISFIHGELLDSRKLKKVIADVDIVYHLAAKVTTPFANIDAHFFEQINHWGTAELVYALEDSHVKKFIFTSSASVYGSSPEEVTEQTVPEPTSYYAISKLRAENHVKLLADKMNTLILRCGNVYGYSKSMRFDALVNRFMFDAHYFKRITINGNGLQYRTFIHIDQLTQILESILTTNVPSGTYNLATKNLEVIAIANVIQAIYPGLEFQYMNQHVHKQELKLKMPCPVFNYMPVVDGNIADELKHFKDQFAFQPV